MTGTKHDKGKTSYTCVPMKALLEIAKVFTIGKEKYGAHNYMGGLSYSRIMDATMRHLIGKEGEKGFWLGCTNDKESGLHSLAHAAAEIMMLLEYELNKDRYKEFDDRYYINEVN